jgi:hypothetical protein
MCQSWFLWVLLGRAVEYFERAGAALNRIAAHEPIRLRLGIIDSSGSPKARCLPLPIYKKHENHSAFAGLGWRWPRYYGGGRRYQRHGNHGRTGQKTQASKYASKLEAVQSLYTLGTGISHSGRQDP